MPDKRIVYLSWTYITKKVENIVKEMISNKLPIEVVLGVKNGGVVPAFMVFERLIAANQYPKPTFGTISADCPEALRKYKGRHILIVDDIYDTGATFGRLQCALLEMGIRPNMRVLTHKADYRDPKNTWIVFPWETDEDTVGGLRQATVALLRGIGENPLREGLKETPRRVEHMWKELTAGYEGDPVKILSTTFSKENYDEMIVVKDIKFFSTCEHHMLPFYGVVHFAYIPDKNVVGLSKVHRLVEMFARRLQIQERMTMQIGKTFEEIVQPKGVAVVVEGVHLCTMVRGVKKENSKMITSYLGGAFRKELPTRQEFLSIIKEK